MSKLVAWGVLALCIAIPATAANIWHKVVAPQFTVYSPGKTSDTLRTAEELAQFVAALQAVIPVDPRDLPPLTVVVFGRDRDFRNYRPKRPNGKPWDVAGFFSRRDSWAVFGLSSANVDADVRRTVFHEAVHWFSSGFATPNPPWLEEGLAEVFSTFAVEKDGAKWGEVIPDHVMVLNSVRALPIERLLVVQRGDPLFNETNRTGEFYAGSWTFVHYLLFGEHAMPRSVLSDYLNLYRTSLHPDEAFKQAFGANYTDMDKRLKQYLSRGRYYKRKIDIVSAAEPLKVEAATALECEAALARLAVGAGQIEQAKLHAENARKLNPESAQASEALGYAAEITGDHATMTAAFTEAARQGSKDFGVYFRLGQTAHQAAAGSGLNSRMEMDGATARRIANNYKKSINLRPKFLPAYQNLAGVVEIADKAGAADQQFLVLGKKLFPGDGMIQLGLAVLDRKLGAEEQARQGLAGVLATVDSQPPHVALYARRLNEAWSDEDFRRRMKALIAEERFTEAIEELDRMLEKGVSISMRGELTNNRRSLKASLLMQSAKNARDEGKWDEARALLDEVLASDAPAMAKQAARKWLATLDQQKSRVR